MRVSILIAITALVALPLYGQQQCQLSDTIAQCWERYLPTPAVATQQTSQQVMTANTGLTNIISPADSALKDFLSLLSTSFESATLTETGQALTLDYNPQFDIGGNPTTLKLQAVFNTTPELSSQLTTALASNATAVTTLDDSLDYTDDVAFSATVNPMSPRFGRSIKPHRSYFQTLFVAVMPNRARENDALIQALTAAGVNSQSARFTDLAAEQQQSTLQIVEGNAKAAAAGRTKTKAFSDAFATLLSNQSQFYASGIYSARRDIVGPNQISAKVTFEYGPRNLSSFQRKNSDCTTSTVTANAAACADKIVDYAKNAASDRLSFSLEYDRTNRRWIDLNEYSVAYGIPRSHRLVYSLTYGRPLTAPMGAQSARLDVALDYEDVQDSGTGDDTNRMVGSATYTYKINDQFSFPIGIVYASHEADLPQSDRQLNAHFGLIYKMPNLPGALKTDFLGNNN